MAYINVEVPVGGAKISIQGGELQVPDSPIIIPSPIYAKIIGSIVI